MWLGSCVPLRIDRWLLSSSVGHVAVQWRRAHWSRLSWPVTLRFCVVDSRGRMDEIIRNGENPAIAASGVGVRSSACGVRSTSDCILPLCGVCSRRLTTNPSTPRAAVRIFLITLSSSASQFRNFNNMMALRPIFKWYKGVGVLHRQVHHNHHAS